MCRSPMAEALLRHRLAERGQAAHVHSTGLVRAGREASAHGVAVVRDRYGLDLSGHRSRTLAREQLQAADVILGMAREHVREAVVLEAAAWARAFTLRELVRRGEEVGPRKSGEALGEWLGRAAAGRSRVELMGSDPADDIADPIGEPRSAYERTAAEIDDLVTRLAALLVP